jgi:phage FluMu protein Com
MKENLKCKICKKHLLLAEDQYSGIHKKCTIIETLKKEDLEESF